MLVMEFSGTAPAQQVHGLEFDSFHTSKKFLKTMSLVQKKNGSNKPLSVLNITLHCIVVFAKLECCLQDSASNMPAGTVKVKYLRKRLKVLCTPR